MAFRNHGYSNEADDMTEDVSPDDIHVKTNGEIPANGEIGTRKSLKKKEPWDVFAVDDKDTISQSDYNFWKVVFKVTRIVFLTIFAVIVCITAVLSKLIFSYMISQINAPNEQNDISLKTFNGSVVYPTTRTEVSWIWALLVCIMAPYFFTLMKGLNKILFKKTKPLKCSVLLIALLVETIHSVGLCILVFIVLPNVDPVVGMIIMSNVGTIPGLLKIMYPSRNKLSEKHGYSKEENYALKQVLTVVINIIVTCLHVGSLGLICYYIVTPSSNQEQRSDIILYLVFACVCISINWWENFVPKGRKDSHGISRLKRSFMESRSKILFVTMLWKIILTSCIFPVIFGSLLCGSECVDMFYFKRSEKLAVKQSIMNTTLTDGTLLSQCQSLGKWLPFLVSILYIGLNIVCFKTAKAACKVVSQKIAFGLPLTLSTPIALTLLLAFMSSNGDYSLEGNIGLFWFGPCKLQFPYWESDEKNPILSLDSPGAWQDLWPLIVGGVVSFLSLLLIVNYIWTPKKERLSSTEKLFVRPLYCGVLLDQSLMLNRRRSDEEYKTTIESNKKKTLIMKDWPTDPDYNPREDWSFLKKPNTPMIYMCATMWHETQKEMTQVLKSICRMDEDQCSRRNLMMYFGIHDPDYYEMETHIFFDDAFEPHGEGEYEYSVNSYVKILLDCVSVAASSVHNRPIKIKEPVRIPTPYGGQLVWKLPGGNKMIAHLKDKQKIRHKKRWSQVMYMYYFLGHKLVTLKKSAKTKQTIADNTFILALDGDVDFQPSAVQLLVDRMKKNLNVGAACGRIHPIGGGPMIWYQKFEYAVSHWLQKAAENMIGCVLCSPGCFSLFRGSSLMDDNVMRKYTEEPKEAYQYVQYDQGEDRWLCTLLLQQGYKVEYVAASDALTFAPEGFYEFYNQRRRWSPSTMANIIDLLLDWKNVTSKNDDISLLCVAYQMLLLASSLLTPGTILLMVLGSLYTAFEDIQPWTAFAVNLTPVAIMVVLCFVAKKEVQLSYAAILSTLYALLMMIVIVGLMKEVIEAGWCSATTYFLLFVASTFVISALLHPQEFWCIIHGMLYFLAIPSMSMLLMIYALGNIHDISWGTRDTGTVAGTPTAGSQQQKRSRMDDIKSWVMGPSTVGQGDHKTSDYQFSFGNLFRCMCCPQSSSVNEDARLRAILERLDDFMETRMTTMSRRSLMSEERGKESPIEDATPFSHQTALFEGAGEERRNPLFTPEKQKPRDDLRDPYWIEVVSTKRGKVEYLEQNEIDFWHKFIERYLKPLDFDKEKKERVEKALVELRNKVCLAFLLMNALFVTIVYTLTEVNKQGGGSLSIHIPCPGSDDKTDETDKGYGKGRIEPISFAFTAVFGVMLLVQFVCMIFHRYSTLLHVISSPTAEINITKNLQRALKERLFRDDEDDGSEQDISRDEGLKLVREMQSTKHETESDTSSVYSLDPSDLESEFGDDLIDTKQPSNLMNKFKKRRNESVDNALSKNFERNFSKFQKVCDAEETVSLNPYANESQEELRKGFVRNAFGKNRLTWKSMRTVVSLMQNEELREQVKRKTEHLQKLKELKQQKNKGMFRNAVFKQMRLAKGPLKSMAEVAKHAKQKDHLEKIEQEIVNLKPGVDETASDPSSNPSTSNAAGFHEIKRMPSVKERRESSSSDSDSDFSDNDDHGGQANGQISDDDSDLSDYETSGKPTRGSFHVNSFKTGRLSSADVLF